MVWNYVETSLPTTQLLPRWSLESVVLLQIESQGRTFRKVNAGSMLTYLDPYFKD